MKQLGRYDFSDEGSYCGEWLDSKFQGYGICTGPRGQGRYSGKWLNGYETSGVYIWPDAHTYEGSWSSGKRHGLGVENKDRWVYKGEWTRGMKGRYGGRYSRTSKACYEGTWATGLQDGYGVETYADRGTYKGQWFQGMRHGHGVRESVAYDQAVHFKPQVKFQKVQTKNKSMESSLSSLYSDHDGGRFDLARRDRRLEVGRGGFVLDQSTYNRDGVSLGGYSSRSADGWSVDADRSGKRLGENLTKTLVKSLKFKKKGPNIAKSLPQSAASSPIRGTIGSVRSLASAGSCRSDRTESQTSFVTQSIIDGSVTEVYAGEWKNDKRCGYGTCSRSDGLKYEGEWYNNKKNGCGVTIYQDGWVEEGKYKDNLLIAAAGNKKTSIFAIRMLRLRDQIDSSVMEARKAAQIAIQKTEVAENRMKMTRMKVDAALQSAEQAKTNSGTAHQISATCCNSLITDASLVDPNLLQKTSISMKNTKEVDTEASGVKKEQAPSGFKQIFNSSLKRSFSRSKNTNNHSLKSKTNSFKGNKNSDFSETSKYFDLSDRISDIQNISVISPDTRIFATHIAGSTYIDNIKNSKDNFPSNNYSQLSSTAAQQNVFQPFSQTQQNYLSSHHQQLQQQSHQLQQQNHYQQKQPNTIQQQIQPNYNQNVNQPQQQQQLQQQKQSQQPRYFQTQATERPNLKRNTGLHDVSITRSSKSPSTLPSPSFLATSLPNHFNKPSRNNIEDNPSITDWLRSQLSWFLLVLTNSLFAIFILWILQRSLV